MSSVDVGDNVQVTFTTTTGATVTVSWFDPDGDTVLDQVAVSESPAASGRYPYTFLPTSAGVWKATFTASGAATAIESFYVRATADDGFLPLATVGDVAAVFGTLTSAQEPLVKSLLKVASKMIRARVPAVDAMVAAGLLDADLVAMAATNMVLRVLRNPSGLRSETVGPFSRSYDTDYAAGMLIFSKDELALLTPALTETAFASPVGTIFAKPGLAPPPYGVTRAWL